MNDALKRRAVSPTVGEIYTINDLEIVEVDDKFNGGKRNIVVLDTDKGRVYATANINYAIIVNGDNKDDFIDQRIEVVTYINKNNREVKSMVYAL